MYKEKDNIVANDKSLIIEIKQYLRVLFAGMLAVDEKEIDIESHFLDMGVSSIEVTAIVNRLTNDLDHEISPTIFFENKNISELALHINENYGDEFNNFVQ